MCHFSSFHPSHSHISWSCLLLENHPVLKMMQNYAKTFLPNKALSTLKKPPTLGITTRFACTEGAAPTCEKGNARGAGVTSAARSRLVTAVIVLLAHRNAPAAVSSTVSQLFSAAIAMQQPILFLHRLCQRLGL